LDDDEIILKFIDTFKNLDIVTLMGGDENISELFDLLFNL